MSTVKCDTLSNGAGTLDVPVDTVVQGSAKAWVNFNGVGTVAIRAAFNVSSITDNGTGDYTVNFTSAMPDTAYSFAGGGRFDTTLGDVNVPTLGSRRSDTVLAGSMRLHTTANTAVTLVDIDLASVVFFR